MLQTYKTNHAAFCAYVDAGFTLFPVYPGTKFPHEGFLQTYFDPEFSPREDSNYGVLLRRRVLILDCDPRNYEANDKPLARLLQDVGLDPAFYKDTYIVKTPRGGFHIYLSKSPETRVISGLKEYPGVEFKDLHIIAAGSYIEKTDKGEPVEKAYQVVSGSPKRILPAPQALLAKIMRKTEMPQALSVSIIPDQPVDIKRFMTFCKETDPAIEGKSGDLTTFKTACRGREYGLSSQMTLQVMKEFFNPRCEPKWTDEQLMVKVASAYSDPAKPIGTRAVQNEFPAEDVKVEEGAKTKTVEIKYHYNPSKTKLLVNLANLKMFFQYPTIDKETNRELKIPAIGNCLGYDKFSSRIVWVKPAPWHKQGNEFDEDDAIMFKSIVSDETTLDFSTQMCFDIALVCAKERAFHPVRDYLDSLKWDGTPRLDGWISRYCGAEDNEYTQFIGRKTLVAAVARAFRPGCKFDHVLVFEGDQGSGKSFVWEHLAAPWFTDAPLSIQDKGAVEVIQGRWIVELGEMEAHSKYESRTIKGFLTRTEDRVRMAYARKAMSFPRQNIFVGTINPEQAGWLKDPTGDRRYWPVPVFTIDLKGIKKDRDQIWAEAYEMFKRGEQIHVEDKKMRDLMATVVSARLQEDPWFGLVENYLKGHAHEYAIDGWVVVLPVEIYTRCVGGTASTCGTREYGRIATILKQMGYEKGRAQGKHGFVFKKKHDAEL